MPKRSLEVVSQPKVKAPKKPRLSNTSLSQILSQADSLVACIQDLQSAVSQGTLTEANVKTLKSLYNTFLPAVNSFASVVDETRTKSNEEREEIEEGEGEQQPTTQNNEPRFEAGLDLLNVDITPWDISQLPESLPCLPAILDSAMEQAVFTHSGLDDAPDCNYERLEWMGDAILQMIATRLIYDSFPQFDPGKSSHRREFLVKNQTLSELSKHYKFHERIRLPSEHRLCFNPHQKDGAKTQKILGDIMEAYTGAVFLSDPKNGARRVVQWLKDIWAVAMENHLGRQFRRDLQVGEQRRHTSSLGPTANDLAVQISTGKSQQNPSTAATSVGATPGTYREKRPKDDLAALLLMPGVRLRYEGIPGPMFDKTTKLPLFSVGVFLDGWGVKDEKLGWGAALGKKEAGQKAARMALDNKAKLKPFVSRKQAHLAALSGGTPQGPVKP